METASILNTNPCIASDFWKKQKISLIRQPLLSGHEGALRGILTGIRRGPSSNSARSLPKETGSACGKDI
jgi:hypothetical protein